MKKILTLFVATLMLASTVQAAFTENVVVKNSFASAAEEKAAAEFLANISPKEYEQATGHHLGLAGWVGLKLAQARLKHNLKKIAKTNGSYEGILQKSLLPKKDKGTNTLLIVLAVVAGVILLFLIILGALIGKWN